MDIYQRLSELGIQLPDTPIPEASYIPAVQTGNLVYASGHTGLVNGKIVKCGKVGAEVSLEEGQASSRAAMINILSSIQSVIGNLNHIERVIRLTGYVASAQNFNQQPMVVNGASDLLIQIFGEKGKHARSAIGVAELPFNAPVELELIVSLKTTAHPAA